MELNEQDDDYEENAYPPKKSESPNKKYNKKNIIGEYIKNPYINKINIDSKFIFDHFDNVKYFQSLKNKNHIKLNQEELSFLKMFYNQNHLKASQFEKQEDFLDIDKNIYEQIINYNKDNKILSPLGHFLKQRILKSDNRTQISCRKLAKEYADKTGNKVGKSTVNNVIRKELGLRYLKTNYKSNYLNKQPGILDSLCFIKIVQKSIKLGFSLIFLDESKIEIENNHYRCWRYPSETIYFGDKIKYKNNLILAVGEDKVIHYIITKENTNSEIFLDFMKGLCDKLNLDKNKKYLIIMDNHPSHKKGNVIQYFVKEKLNIIFNAPYNSPFNAVELAFRSIKRKTYSKIYSSIDEVKSDIIEYLESEDIKKTLFANFNETIRKYIIYTEDSSDININNFDNIK